MTILRSFKSLAASSLVALAVLGMTGCFNTYTFEPDEFGKLQNAQKGVPQTVKSKDGDDIVVDRGTNIFVRSVGGRRYSLTPYNFKLTRSQLVASDRDTLLMKSEIEEYEVDLLSTPLTVLLISAGVAVAGGLIALAVVQSQ